jgi:hypothetical protein
MRSPRRPSTTLSFGKRVDGKEWGLRSCYPGTGRKCSAFLTQTAVALCIDRAAKAQNRTMLFEIMAAEFSLAFMAMFSAKTGTETPRRRTGEYHVIDTSLVHPCESSVVVIGEIGLQFCGSPAYTLFGECDLIDGLDFAPGGGLPLLVKMIS